MSKFPVILNCPVSRGIDPICPRAQQLSSTSSALACYFLDSASCSFLSRLSLLLHIYVCVNAGNNTMCSRVHTCLHHRECGREEDPSFKDRNVENQIDAHKDGRSEQSEKRYSETNVCILEVEGIGSMET